MKKPTPRSGDRVRIKDDVYLHSTAAPKRLMVPAGTIGLVLYRRINEPFYGLDLGVTKEPYNVIKVDKRRRGVLVSEVWVEDKDVEIIKEGVAE